MPDEFPTFNEMQTALNLVHKHETELGTHDRMLLNIYRQISISDQKSILSHLMERAQIYNATIVATGYASFFVAWRFLQSEYGTELPLYDLSLILMLFSVLVFVIWNVYSSIQLGRDLNRKIETIARNHHDPLYLFQALKSLDQEIVNNSLKRYKIWYIALFLTIIPGIFAVAILFYFSIRGIIFSPH